MRFNAFFGTGFQPIYYVDFCMQKTHRNWKGRINSGGKHLLCRSIPHRAGLVKGEIDLSQNNPFRYYYTTYNILCSFKYHVDASK